MSYPTYFSNFPNNKYTLSVNKAGKPSYFNIKDFFHLMKVRDDIFREDTLYYTYNVKNGQRPEQIAYEEYGDEQYYWIILQVNEIVDYYNQWPLSYQELQEYTLKKYGSYEAAANTHHYETVEVLDSSGNLVLPGGMVVSEDFSHKYWYDDELTLERVSYPVSVSNAAWEETQNNRKSEIQLLQSKYISDYVREVRNYAKNLNPQVSSVNISDYFR